MLPARGDGQARPPVPAGTTDFEPARKAATRLLEKEMRKNDVVGLSIALVDDRRVIWSRGFGFADKKAGIPASPETIYRIGSITKLFRASVAMQLAEKGALRIMP